VICAITDANRKALPTPVSWRAERQQGEQQGFFVMLLEEFG
jgi:hypothetical protein